MRASSQKKHSFIFLIAGFVAFVFVLSLPVPEGLSIPARNMMAVVCLMSFWWLGEAIPVPVTALLPLALFPLLGILPSSQVGPFYGNHLIFLFLGGFMIALSMERCGLHKRFALTLIQLTGVELKRLVLGFMMASAILSMWISNTATTLMLLPVAMAVVRQVADCTAAENENSEAIRQSVVTNFGLVLMLGLAYSASLGGIGTLIGTPPNIVLAGFLKTRFPGREEISFLEWMTLTLPLVLVMLPVVWWYLCRWVSSVPLERFQSSGGATRKVLKHELALLGPMSRQERFVAVIFSITAFLWIFRKSIVLGDFTIPGWSSFLPWPGLAHDATVAMSMGILLMAVPVREKGSKGFHAALDWETFVHGVPWGILLLFGGGFALAGGLQATGLDVWVGNGLTGILDWPLWLVVLCLCLGLTFLTELTSNTATATMILPVIASAAEATGIEPLYLLIPATLSVSFAFMMPVATPPNAIVFGSGWVSLPQMARAGFVLNLLGAVAITLLTLFWLPRALF